MRRVLLLLAILLTPTLAVAQAQPTVWPSTGSPVTIVTSHYISGAGVTNGQVCFDVTSAGDTCLSRSAAGKLTLTGTTPMIQLGGTTSSFVAIKGNSTTVQAKLADDSGLATMQVGALQLVSMVFNTAAPTISSGFGTSPTIPNHNGPAAFTVNVGTGGTATTGVIGLPAATTGWNCWVRNLTAQAAHIADRETRQVASTTTTASFENQIVSTGATAGAPWAASDILRVSCFAY